MSSTAHVDLLREAALHFRGDERVTPFAEAPGALAFVAVDDAGNVIGWCWGHHLVRPDSPPMLYLHELEVAEEHRRHGHGRALLDAFMAAGKAAGATKMFLSTARANEPARRLYESVGGGLAAQGPTLKLLVPASLGQARPAPRALPLVVPSGSRRRCQSVLRGMMPPSGGRRRGETDNKHRG